MAVMMTPRETWTDQRLDDLNKKVDDGFARLDGDVKDLRREMNERFDGVNRTLIAVLVAVVGSNATIVAALIGVNAF